MRKMKTGRVQKDINIYLDFSAVIFPATDKYYTTTETNRFFQFKKIIT